MKFTICPENHRHTNGTTITTAYYLFGANSFQPHRDIYDGQGYVIEAWNTGEFYILDGAEQFVTRDFAVALDYLRTVMGEAPEPDTFDGLTAEIQQFIAEEGLPERSVDELIFEDLQPHQRRVASQFLLRWDAIKEH